MPLQLEEDLEQLKVLENGYKMKVFKFFFCILGLFVFNLFRIARAELVNCMVYNKYDHL